MKKLPLPLFKVHMPDGVHKALNKVIYSGFIGQGKYVDKFEKKLSSYFNNPNLLTVNAATSAIHLALRLCDVKNNDEVIENHNSDDFKLKQIFKLRGIYDKIDEKSKNNTWKYLQALIGLTEEYIIIKKTNTHI